MKIEHVPFPSIFFFKITDSFDGKSFNMFTQSVFQNQEKLYP